MLNANHPLGSHVLIVNAASDGLGAWLVLPGRCRCGGGLTADGLVPGRPQHAGRAENLIRLDQHAECPFLPADVGMEGFALPAIRVADLLQRRIRRDAQDRLRVDVKAEGSQAGSPLASSFSNGA